MAHGVKRDRFYCCCSDFALKLLLLAFVTPVMTRELAHNDVGMMWAILLTLL